MYRSSAQLTSYVTHKPPLSGPKTDSEAEDEIAVVLRQKRKDLDEEIARFTAAKDQEFREFEKELRLKKQFQRIRAVSLPPKSPATSTSPSVLNLLGEPKPTARKDQSPVRDSRAPNGVVVGGRKRPPPISKPTLSLDRLNITGETTPPLNISGTPPNQSALTRQLSRSPIHGHVPPFTPPRSRPPKSPLSNRTEADAFTGLFTPAYLPMLDSRNDEKQGTPEPIVPRVEPERRSSFSAPIETLSSVTRNQVKRALTAPTLPSSSLPLPSALRTASGTNVRKRKHVTFQLADSAIVDPASSYEEMPSPSFDSDTLEFERRDSEVIESSDSEATATPTSVGTPDLRDEASRMPRSLSLPPSVLTTDDRSLSVQSAIQPEDGFKSGLESAEDGGSGVGFFELDEELNSPKKTEVTRFEFDETDLNEAEDFHRLGLSNVGLSSAEGIRPRTSPRLEAITNTTNRTTNEDGVGQDVDDGAVVGTGEKSIRIARPGLSGPQFSSGSVPINIVKPTGSWVGSFGH